MSNKMLIDASHPEETRVVVIRGSKIEEFDFESEYKKQLKGNIYLARVTRVEPSLQAAFVEYGGNRHGFLTFSEIHPDYYQIPVADRLALLEREVFVGEDYSDDLFEESDQNARNSKGHEDDSAIIKHVKTDTLSETQEANNEEESPDINMANGDIEMIGTEDVREELPTYQSRQGYQYKIQEVIKRRQILLVQIIKEERGNKGAALTTYLSLAGRYSVLVPNTARGGGISRKITNIQDRKRLKDIVKELDIPNGMGIILRTAGANRTKAEIKRDYEYLMRLWDTIRTLTLKSNAPCLVHEESSIIKRSIRDLYNKTIDEILVSGEKGYREAKDFMRMLMPSHAKVVQPYRAPTPIFTHNSIETQLDKMLHPQVTLKSGGYLVINQTEALVSIDVNSGRSTKEHSVEKTALQTNLEAAEEIARQLRLRDLAGLIVIDFIDMLDSRNVKLVEKKLKECLKNDRARIQVGHISHFGLLEMSRQRIRISVLESTTQLCPHCNGTGNIRSESSIALHVMRSIEEYLLHHPQHNIIVRTPMATALYILNHKRNILVNLETRFKLNISVEADDSIGTQHLVIMKGTMAVGVSYSSPILEENNKKDIENPILTGREFPEHEVRIENNRKPQNKKHPSEISTSSVSDFNKNSIQNDENARRRRGRRERRGGRRNQENNFHNPRVPYAEPVGDFSKQALKAIKEERRRDRIPSAELVGFEHKTEHDEQAIRKSESVKINTVTKPEKRNAHSKKAQKSSRIHMNRQNRTKRTAVKETRMDNHMDKTEVKVDEVIHDDIMKDFPSNTKKNTYNEQKRKAFKKTSK